VSLIFKEKSDGRDREERGRERERERESWVANNEE
jgi:hypothetical protein